MESSGIIIWIGALVVLMLYVVRLALQQPRGCRLALGSYWLLFIVSPLAIFGVIVSFSASALIVGFVLLVVLCVIGERGLRLWSRLFKSVR
jgi:hypothetical protein